MNTPTDMIGVFERMVWAMRSTGLTPAAKLVLILAADGSDCECRHSDLGRLLEGANLTPAGFDAALSELVQAGAIVRGRDFIELLVRGVG